MEKITFRSINDVRSRKFNVTSEGVKIERDVNGKEYITGSADNVKHCIMDIMCQNDGYRRPKRIHEKALENKNKSKGIKKCMEEGISQGGLITKIDLYNPLTTLGAWDSTSGNEEYKYKGIAIKSCINFGYFLPLSTELVSISNREFRVKEGKLCGATGVCVGNDNDELAFVCKEDKNKTKHYNTPEEMSEDGWGTLEDCVLAFNSERKMNTYDKSPLINGLFVLECEIDMTTFGRYRLYDIKLSEDMCGEFIEKGWKIVEINGQKFLEMPEDERKKLFESFVRALHEFEFMSNNSVAGNPLRLVRTTFGYKAANKVEMSTLYDKYEKKIIINDRIKGVQSFNTPLLREWVNVKELGIETDYNAIDNSIEKMIELGNSIIG